MGLKRCGVLSLIACLLLSIGCSGDSDNEMTKVDDSTTGVDPSLPLAPNFTLLNTALEEVSLADHQGKVVLVDFWATWCKPCETEMPIFIELYDQYRAQGFEILGISMDDERLKVVEPFIERLGVNYTILLGEPGLIEKYHVFTMPSAFLINRDGQIVKAFNGAQGEKATYERELKKLL